MCVCVGVCWCLCVVFRCTLKFFASLFFVALIMNKVNLCCSNIPDPGHAFLFHEMQHALRSSVSSSARALGQRTLFAYGPTQRVASQVEDSIVAERNRQVRKKKRKRRRRRKEEERENWATSFFFLSFLFSSEKKMVLIHKCMYTPHPFCNVPHLLSVCVCLCVCLFLFVCCSLINWCWFLQRAFAFLRWLAPWNPSLQTFTLRARACCAWAVCPPSRLRTATCFT